MHQALADLVKLVDAVVADGRSVRALADADGDSSTFLQAFGLDDGRADVVEQVIPIPMLTFHFIRIEWNESLTAGADCAVGVEALRLIINKNILVLLLVIGASG